MKHLRWAKSLAEELGIMDRHCETDTDVYIGTYNGSKGVVLQCFRPCPCR
jgi:hypothetical protein